MLPSVRTLVRIPRSVLRAEHWRGKGKGMGSECEVCRGKRCALDQKSGCAGPVYEYVDQKSRSDKPGNRVPRMPVDQWSMIISYQPIDPLRINLEGRYVGSRFNDVSNKQSMPAFDVWNVSATYDVKKRVQMYVRARQYFQREV